VGVAIFAARSGSKPSKIRAAFDAADDARLQDIIIRDKAGLRTRPIPVHETRGCSRVWPHPPRPINVDVSSTRSRNTQRQHPTTSKRVIAIAATSSSSSTSHPKITDWLVPSCEIRWTYEFDRARKRLRKRTASSTWSTWAATLVPDHYEDQRDEGIQGRRITCKPGETWVMATTATTAATRAPGMAARRRRARRQIKGRAMFVWLNFRRTAARFGTACSRTCGSPKLPAGAPPDIVAGIAKCLKTAPTSRSNGHAAPARIQAPRAPARARP